MMRKPTIDNQAVWQLYQDGLTQREISKRLGCTEAAISKKIKVLKKRNAPLPESFEFLPDKVRGYVLAKAEGKNNIDAVFASHDAVTTRASAKTIATRLNSQPEVQQAITDIMNSEGIDRRYLVQKLGKHINSDEPNISLRGVEMGLKLHGELVNRNVNINVNVDCDPVDLSIFRRRD